MSETPVRFGVLGCATIARILSRAIRLAPNASISAIGSRSIDKASKFASDDGFPASAKVYGSYEAVLDDPEVDAVYLPLPTSLHLKWAVLAAEKKKHLLLEKPVNVNGWYCLHWFLPYRFVEGDPLSSIGFSNEVGAALLRVETIFILHKDDLQDLFWSRVF
ncbi:putative oxidoreductase [Camellia lanceoleosa]|uniref:Oxidoreductase n=1 Tax=Camellia lanceoleosa TaxID=1840588 RepID=A0ACC0GXA2_9ERIC|nr:putative oxidoreductase [Camellia lanceoleosa]